MSRFGAHTRHPRWAVDSDSFTDHPPVLPTDSATSGIPFGAVSWAWIWFILFLSLLALVVYCLFPFRRLAWFVIRNRFINLVMSVGIFRSLFSCFLPAEEYGATAPRTSSVSIEGHLELTEVQDIQVGLLALCPAHSGDDPVELRLGERSSSQASISLSEV